MFIHRGYKSKILHFKHKDDISWEFMNARLAITNYIISTVGTVKINAKKKHPPPKRSLLFCRLWK
jgi:hypothetical protein